eukprot:gene14274-5303_t
MAGLIARKNQAKLAEQIYKGTHFSRNEVERLLDMFRNLVPQQKCKMDRTKFRTVLHNTFQMTDDILMDRDCFEVYDLNGDGYIQREEMFHMLKNCLIKQPTEEDPDEGVRDLVETTLKLMDLDKDGRLSFEDYRKSVEQDNLLLEAFGQCLPDAKYVQNFSELFAD